MIILKTNKQIGKISNGRSNMDAGGLLVKTMVCEVYVANKFNVECFCNHKVNPYDFIAKPCTFFYY